MITKIAPTSTRIVISYAMKEFEYEFEGKSIETEMWLFKKSCAMHRSSQFPLKNKIVF